MTIAASIEQIADIAIRAWADVRTAMSAAMLRALGIDPADIAPAPDRLRLPSTGSAWADADIAECFANSASPMDGRF